MSDKELIETLKLFEKQKVDNLPKKSRRLFYAIMKIADERDKYKSIVEELDQFVDHNTQFDYQGGDEENHSMEWYEVVNITNNQFIRGINDILSKRYK